MASPHVSTLAHEELQGHSPVALVLWAPPAQLTALWFTLALRDSHADSTIPKVLPGPHLGSIVETAHGLVHVKCGLGAQIIKGVSKAPSSAKSCMCLCVWLFCPPSRSLVYPTTPLQEVLRARLSHSACCYVSNVSPSYPCSLGPAMQQVQAQLILCNFI